MLLIKIAYSTMSYASDCSSRIRIIDLMISSLLANLCKNHFSKIVGVKKLDSILFRNKREMQN